MLTDEAGNIWFRQSWLDTAQRCPERGRFALVHPECNEAINDSALIGVATHAAIQLGLENPDLSEDDVAEHAYATAIEMADTADVYWVTWTLPGQLGEHARRCARAWYREIRPSIVTGGRCEVEFQVPLFKLDDGRIVGIKGTTDYIQPDGVIIDWKTASRKFQQREKQRAAIQPTVYAVAAVHGGLDQGQRFEYPVTFRYGVMVRGNEAATTQIIDVQRTRAHEGWLLDKLNSYVELGERMGTERHWPRDEDHHLCNQTWCPWWAMCKGARLSVDQDRWSAA